MLQEEYTYDDVNLLIKEKKFQQAINLLLGENGKLLKRHEDDAVNAWFHVGDIFKKIERYEEAIVAYRHSIEDYPGDPIVWLDMGDCYCSLEFFSEAVRCYRNALDIGETDRQACTKLTNVLLRIGEFEKALVCLKNTSLKNEEFKKTFDYTKAKVEILQNLNNSNIKIRRNLELQV